jgi:hypothetical protein
MHTDKNATVGEPGPEGTPSGGGFRRKSPKIVKHPEAVFHLCPSVFICGSDAFGVER